MELQDTIVNIGKITVGETKEFDFWVYNSSDDSVLVDLVTPDCHCTKVEYKNAYFQSGDTIKFHILFDTHREVPGEWDRYINLQFRSAATGEIVDYGFTFIYEV